ncbi:cytochrome b-c1 complex subunit 9 [Mustelus asterias]
MALVRQVYNFMFKRSSTFALSIILGAVLFERVFDQAGDAMFERINQGVSVRCGGCLREGAAFTFS